MRGLSFRLLLALCLLASTAQGFIAQTHVHAQFAAAVGVGAGAGTQADALPGDEAKCVLCEIAGHSPSLAPPAAVESHLTAAVTGFALPAVGAAVPVAVPSHHWSGRAPPSSPKTSA